MLSKVGTSDVGCFRIRPKIHKSPLEGRPVFNFNASWIQPIAIFLSETLNPLVNDCEHVLLNTDNFLERLINSQLPLDSDLIIEVEDVKHLYPSIDHDDLMRRISIRIRRHFSDQVSFASLVINLISTIMKCQHITFGKCTWKVITGIGTGLACGAQLANLYLADLDDELAPLAHFYGRYLDDVFCITNTRNNILDTANTFHRSIKLEVASQGRSNVPFLDLALSLGTSNVIFYKLYRKPANAYQYLPRGSCHRAETFNGLVVGESIRI